MRISDEGRSNAAHWYERAQAAEAKLAASEAACAQMRSAFEWLILQQGVEHSDPDCPEDDTCSCPEVAMINAALATDAGKGYVSTEGAVEAEVMQMPLSDGNAALAAIIPADWIGKRVLIIRKPEGE